MFYDLIYVTTIKLQLITFTFTKCRFLHIFLHCSLKCLLKLVFYKYDIQIVTILIKCLLFAFNIIITDRCISASLSSIRRSFHNNTRRFTIRNAETVWSVHFCFQSFLCSQQQFGMHALEIAQCKQLMNNDSH